MTLAALRTEKTENKTFTLAGPKAFTVQEVIELCEEMAGRDADVTQVPVWLLKATRGILRRFQWARDAADRLVSLLWPYIEISRYSRLSKCMVLTIKSCLCKMAGQLVTIAQKRVAHPGSSKQRACSQRFASDVPQSTRLSKSAKGRNMRSTSPVHTVLKFARLPVCFGQPYIHPHRSHKSCHDSQAEHLYILLH